MDVTIKAHLQRADSTVEVRRILVTFPPQGTTKSGIFSEVLSKLTSIYPGLADKNITLKWKDADEDFVTMTTDEEMLEAASNTQNSALKIFITVDGVKESRPDETVDMDSDGCQELPASGKKGKHDCEEEDDDDLIFTGSMGMPFPPPPPPPAGFEYPGCSFGFGGLPRGMRKRGHPEFSDPRGHPEFFNNPRGHHFGHHGARGHPFSHHGLHGQPFDPRGQPFGHHGPHGQPFGHHGPHGHPFGHHGPHGHPFGHHEHHGPQFGHLGPRGHHMGMFGSFGGHGCFGRFGDARGGHHHGNRHHHHGKEGWKANLRDAVPVAHRRWAKAFIQNWRVENLKNATSTSSDSEQEVVSMEDANVPEAYARWLEALLPKWYRQVWQEAGAASKEKANSSQDKSQLKASVPLEFRKWTKWYLARHFGKKEQPKFRKHGGGGCHYGGKLDKHRKKEWKKACKMQTVAGTIPLVHRMWAKIFIQDWRQEHQIPDPGSKARSTVSSESEDTEKEARPGDVTVPNDYIRWMRKFLVRWHLWKGHVEKQNVEVEKGGMGEFKDSVPKNFRKWVKCFLWRRYGGGVFKEADTACQYQKWLKVFQQKWLRDQEKGGNIDELVITSSDEEAAVQLLDSESENTMESSLKKLRLEGGEEGSKKHVQFQANAEGGAADKEKTAAEGDKSGSEGALFHKQLNAGFRHWAKEALWQWDGRTDPTAGQEEGAAEQIPPHIYNWMSRMMTKVQMKKVKQGLKEVKKSAKSAKKAQKYNQI